MPVAISAAEEAQVHDASEALHREISRVEDDDSHTQAAPQAAEPMPPARTAATVRDRSHRGRNAHGLYTTPGTAGCNCGYYSACISNAGRYRTATRIRAGFAATPGWSTVAAVYSWVAATNPASPHSAYLRTAAVPTLRRPSLQRPFPLPGHFPRLDDSTQLLSAACFPHRCDATYQPGTDSVRQWCTTLWCLRLVA